MIALKFVFKKEKKRSGIFGVKVDKRTAGGGGALNCTMKSV